jgi:hypothetical protein
MQVQEAKTQNHRLIPARFPKVEGRILEADGGVEFFQNLETLMEYTIGP